MFTLQQCFLYIKQKITGKTVADGTKNIGIMVPLKDLIFGELLKCFELIVKLI